MKDILANSQGLEPRLIDAERMSALAGLVGPILGDRTMEFVEADYRARAAERPVEAETPNVGGIPIPEPGTIQSPQTNEVITS